MSTVSSHTTLPAAPIFRAGLPPRDLNDSTWTHWATEAFGFRSITRLGLGDIGPETIRLIPGDLARELKVVPAIITDKGGERHLVLAMTDPLDAETIIEARIQAGMEITPVVAQTEIIDWALDLHYPLDS